MFINIINRIYLVNIISYKFSNNDKIVQSARKLRMYFVSLREIYVENIKKTKREIKIQTRYIRATISCQIIFKKFAELHDNAAENFISVRPRTLSRTRELSSGTAILLRWISFYFRLARHPISGRRVLVHPQFA